MTHKQKNTFWHVELTELTYSINVGKTYRMENGEVITSTEGNGFEGGFRTVSLFSVADICTLQDNLKSHQCLIAGTSTVDAEFGRLGSYRDGCHERTKEWFPEPWCHALVTCDIDRGGAPSTLLSYMESAAEVARLFFEVVPQIRGAALLVRPSSSNGVCYPDGRPAKEGGWHVHLVAPPRKRTVIMERLYATFARAGFGWIKVSAFPSLLKRNPVDTALFLPNQPIYSGLPRVKAPLILERPACFIQEGCAFDPDWLPNKVPKDVEYLYDKLKKAPEILAKIETCISSKAEVEVPVTTPNRTAVVDEVKLRLRKQVGNAQRGFLYGNFPISIYKGPTITVAQILANAQHYNRALTLTPGEEEYRGGAQTGIIYASEMGVKLHTQAHGGITYTLLYDDPDNITSSIAVVNKPTKQLSPHEAKRQLRMALANWPHEIKFLAVKATQGLGKTSEVLTRMAAETNLNLLFLASTLKQCEQVFDEYCERHRGNEAAICRGRTAPDPTAVNTAMCTQPARCENALARGATRLSTSACLNCPDFNTCGYQKQAKAFGQDNNPPRIIFATHDYAHYSLPGGWTPDAVVLDEVLRTGGVDEEMQVPDSDLALHEKMNPENALAAHSVSGEALDWTNSEAIRAHRYKSELLQAMISKDTHYLLTGMWIVPKYREFVHADKPVLVIDGTLRQNLLEMQLRQKFELVQIEARRNVYLIQVVGNDAGSFATKTAFTGGTSEPVKRYLISVPSNRCLFTYKAVRSALGREEDSSCGHFSGDIRGSNRFKDFHTSLIFGRLQIPEAVALGRARVLAQANKLPVPSCGIEWIERSVQTLYQGIIKVKYITHNDPLVQSIIESAREDEIEQAIDRLRLVWHEGDPKVVIVVNNLPLPVEPMAVLCWGDVREGRAAPEAVHATLTGLIPASGEQGPALRPDLWSVPSTATRHMKKQLKPNWKDWFQRFICLPASTGKRKQGVEVCYRPAGCQYTAEYLKLLQMLEAKSPRPPYKTLMADGGS